MGEVGEARKPERAAGTEDGRCDEARLFLGANDPESANPHVALLFAGQGAQHPGMGREIRDASPAAAAVFAAADRARPGTSAQCFEGDAQELALTKNTQPCVFATDLACAAALGERGVRPACVAGFSLGELAALTFAGAMSLGQGFAVVGERARLMEQACEANPGGMVAVLKLSPDAVEGLAGEAGECWPVNYNSPQQTVVAGSPDGLARLAELVKRQGGRAMPLAVSGAFHSPAMAGATQALLPMLRGVGLAVPQADVWANATAAPYPHDVEEMAELLASQASHAVLWTDTLRGMWGRGVTTFVEVGAGHVLTGLVRRTLPEATAVSVETPAQLDEAVAAVEAARTADGAPAGDRRA
ncbi:MAG: ACP S-malonyltransferase [Coriobacteriales bacterium]|jgi:[acyl-carrier-protein] S-malonyltransferase